MWEWLCLPIVNRVGSWLRAGVRRGWRRKLLAASLKEFRRHAIFFFTVQGPSDEQRLRAGGSPWPTGAFRAHLGPGIYAWMHLADAREYRRMLLRFGADFRILRFAVPRGRLLALRTIDVDELDDPETWMRRHSLLWTDDPADHGAQYVRRRTSVPRGSGTAVEHFFSATVVRRLWYWMGMARAD